MKRIPWRRVVTAALLATAPQNVARAQQTVATAPAASESTTGADTLLARAVTVRLDRVSRSQALDAIAASAKVPVYYHAEAVDADAERITLHLNRQALKLAITQALQGTNLQLRVLPGPRIAIVGRDDANAAQQGGTIITGRVTDSATAEGIPDVHVAVRGTTLAVETRKDGRFAFTNVPVGTQTLEFRKLGFGSFTRTVDVVEGKPVVVSVTLSVTRTVLTGVVTTATGLQRRLTLGNDITVVNVDSVLKTMPVTTISQLLATRVPGLVATPTNGEPGSPTLIRIRGMSSLSASNDPLVIIDGVRVYSAQGWQGRFVNGTREGDRSTNLVNSNELVSSPLDEIDPNSIETFEVLKGPSAVALYGTDAANGVIVLTTKHGHNGPAQWSVSGSWGQSKMRGSYSDNYWMWGHTAAAPNTAIQCTIQSSLSGTAPCIQDSLATYQLLNNSNTSIFGTGSLDTYRADVRGGTGSITYALSASTTNNIGIVQIPNEDIAALHQLGVSVPDWQRKPDQSGQNSATLNVASDLNPKVHVSVTSTLDQNTQRTTPFGAQALGTTQTLPPGGQAVVSNTPIFGTGLLQAIPTFRNKSTSNALRFTSAVNASAQPFSFLTTTGTFGIDQTHRDDQSILPNGACFQDAGPLTTCQSGASVTNTPLLSGFYNTGDGNARATSVTLNGIMPLSFGDWLTVRTSIGGNYNRTTTNDLANNAGNIAPGVSSGNTAGTIKTTASGYDNITAGVYGELNIGLGNRLYLTPSVRKDAGSGLGADVSPYYPKMGVSYVLSDEPLFKRLPFANAFSTLRLRMAYGRSGIQPQATAKFRSYMTLNVNLEGTLPTPVTRLYSIGNPDLQPETTQEYEGGVDANFLNDRVTLSVTLYQKRTQNALVSQELPASLGEYYMESNVGKIQNTGTEITLGLTPFETRLFTWNTSVGITSQRNRVISYNGINFDILSNADGFTGSTYNRVVVGYPLYGVWTRPILSYADIDGNGVITANELSLGDSLVYAGAPYPNYEASFSNTFTILRRISVGVTMQYQNGLTQQYLPPSLNNLRSWNDPSTPLPVQAFQAAALQVPSNTNGGSTIGFVQTTSVLRLNELSISYSVPDNLTRHLIKAHQMRIALQGQNLGVWSNYRGNDPDVNANLRDYTVDASQVPTPRTWMLTVGIN